jgi:regulator of sigma E protease
MPILTIFSRLADLSSLLWCNLPLIIVAVLGIGFLIVFHELGHLIFAKIFNVYAPSFSIGFGPRLLEIKLGETTYALSAIPLGGYVELAGSEEIGQGEQAHAKATDERSFGAKPYWQKLLIMLGGISFNILFAYVALTLLFTMGAPCIGSWCQDKVAYVGAVHPGTPADKAGLQAGDTIAAIGGIKTTTIKEVSTALIPFIQKPVMVSIERDGQTIEKEITPGEQTVGTEKKPLLGVSWQVKKMGIIDAFANGWSATWSLIVQTAKALKDVTKSREGLGGPLMLYCQVTQFAGMGLKMFLFILAFISINLAVFNVIPLPIFDGGQVLFFSIEALLNRPLSDRVRYYIHMATWILVGLLVLYLTFKDIIKLSTGV